MTLETQNKLRVGDKVEYETVPDPATHDTQLVPGVITRIVSPTKVIIQNTPGTGEEIEVEAEYCERVFDCELCEDVGYSTIPAHQRGGDIVDEQQIPCSCEKGKEFKRYGI